MHLDVEHRLTFSYDAFVSQSSMELRMEPRMLASQSVGSFYLAVGPPAKVFRYLDWNENLVHHFTVTDFHDRIEVIARSLVETEPEAIELASIGDPLPSAEARGRLRDFVGFNGPVRRGPALRELGKQVPVEAGAPLGLQIEGIGQFVYERLRYLSNVTDWKTTSEDVLEAGVGVCQDFAHVMLGLLRLREIPCRYVSGYLHVDHADSGEVSQSHAWVEVWSPSRGWVAYDPTHRQVPDERYVVVGYGRHYDDVPPNHGIFRGAAVETLEASVVTKPASASGGLGLREEMGQIDLPVYAEVPAGRTAAPTVPQDRSPDQQQQ